MPTSTTAVKGRRGQPCSPRTVSTAGRQRAGMGEGNLVQGRANLAKFCEADRVSCVHMLHLPHFVIDGDAATSRILVQHRGQFIEHGRPTQTQSTGCYDVTYRRTGEGWRILPARQHLLRAAGEHCLRLRALHPGYRRSAAPGVGRVSVPGQKGLIRRPHPASGRDFRGLDTGHVWAAPG